MIDEAQVGIDQAAAEYYSPGTHAFSDSPQSAIDLHLAARDAQAA
jgi:hypothetical protein